MSAFLAQLPSTDPAQILRYRDRQYAAELLAAAIVHLDLFSWLQANAGASTEALRAHFDFAERPADVLLTLCRANGFIATEDDRHSLTPLAGEFLCGDSPWNLRPYYTPIQDTQITQDFLTVLRNGKPANWQAQEDGSDWHASMLDEDFARGFTELMNCRGLAFGQKLTAALEPQLAGKKTLLDVGGGSGIYASTMLAAQPHLIGAVLEQPPVDAIAREEIARHGLQERLEVISADMFAGDWPTCDVLLLSNVLHDWDFPEVRTLCAKAAAALESGGLLVIHEAFIHDDKTGPLPVAEYSALLMNICQGKCYTPLEYGGILAELDFEVGPYIDTIADRGYMTAVKR
ncbi:MAG: methyltransferase [Verrucomicrobiales bacterium]|nr:methyltransferase [Verrucomicrobiales bacterium]|tara:strand:+ start:9009 stop:10046 length:1038 start_codon:yes stop_codon:yes gene_type:complete